MEKDSDESTRKTDMKKSGSNEDFRNLDIMRNSNGETTKTAKYGVRALRKVSSKQLFDSADYSIEGGSYLNKSLPSIKDIISSVETQTSPSPSPSSSPPEDKKIRKTTSYDSKTPQQQTAQLELRKKLLQKKSKKYFWHLFFSVNEIPKI